MNLVQLDWKPPSPTIFEYLASQMKKKQSLEIENSRSETLELGHSEEHFSAERNYWFNQDFLDLMAKRWQLQRFSTLLDVGSGLCHWSKLLVPYLSGDKQITAFDKDRKWAKGNAEIIDFFKQQNASVQFRQGDAHVLPFADQSFDVVTCQTLLIHVSNPELVLREMKRVVKKNGIVICSEPNNRIQTLIQDTSNHSDDPHEVLKRVKQNLFFEKHKEARNDGNQSFGDLLTGTMNALGFKNIQAYLNDKLISIYPPYASREQQLKINVYLRWGKTHEEIAIFEREYEAAERNNTYPNFLKNHAIKSTNNKVLKGLKNQTYANGGASLLYLISGN